MSVGNMLVGDFPTDFPTGFFRRPKFVGKSVGNFPTDNFRRDFRRIIPSEIIVGQGWRSGDGLRRTEQGRGGDPAKGCVRRRSRGRGCGVRVEQGRGGFSGGRERKTRWSSREREKGRERGREGSGRMGGGGGSGGVCSRGGGEKRREEKERVKEMRESCAARVLVAQLSDGISDGSIDSRFEGLILTKVNTVDLGVMYIEVQLVRIQLRVPEYGWTTQKVFHFLNFLVNGVRCLVFVFRRDVQKLNPEIIQHIVLDMPSLAFFTTYALLVLFWAEIYYQARAVSTDGLRPTFYTINGVVYAIQVNDWLQHNNGSGEITVQPVTK
ncbi:hypothetical protein RD792_015204, partial [Penstemon davidsonii]